jgi:hypothetical protein
MKVHAKPTVKGRGATRAAGHAVKKKTTAQRMKPTNRLLDRVKKAGGEGASQEAVDEIKKRKYAEQTIVRYIFSKTGGEIPRKQVIEIYEQIEGALGHAPEIGEVKTWMDNNWEA